MTTAFAVHATPAFERRLKKLIPRHPELVDHYAEALAALQEDPHNRSRAHKIKKLGPLRYRFQRGRWRFTCTIERRVVWLTYCGLRREDTYRS